MLRRGLWGRDQATFEVRLSESPKGKIGMYRGHRTGKEGNASF